MKVEIIGTDLVITAPIDPNPPLSSTKKSLLIATTHGTITTTCTVNGKLVKLSFNAMVSAK